MADARSLLRAAANARAKTGGGGISDRFASYSASGALRCSACDYATIKHDSLWGAHVLSKSHRSNAARIREEELREAETRRTKDGKRKADDEEDDSNDGDSAGGGRSPREGATDNTGSGAKKPRTDTKAFAEASTAQAESIDPEWELFKSQMDASGPESGAPEERYDAGATIEAEAQLISQEGTNGAGTSTDDGAIEEQSAAEKEAQERARRELEEREEILSRLEEEQRQQDEADQRVSALKQRLQRIRQARLDKQKAATTDKAKA
ncbi:uncharacterized protein PSANT_04108 [Moesziomyces antarcticus]|nr:uncharacterized protein PSANT_04108 [Moesziomyces antarcticus]